MPDRNWWRLNINENAKWQALTASHPDRIERVAVLKNQTFETIAKNMQEITAKIEKQRKGATYQLLVAFYTGFDRLSKIKIVSSNFYI